MVSLCMKKSYKTIDVSVVLFSNEDIITASGDGAKSMLDFATAMDDTDLDFESIFLGK